MPDSDEEIQHGKHYAPIAKPVDQSPNHCATTLKSECSMSMGILPGRNEGPNGCAETYASQDTSSSVTVFQGDLLE